MFSLRRIRTPQPALPSLLLFERLVAPGVVKTSRGGYLVGWYYRGPDVASSTASERNQLASTLNAALLRLGNGWCSWSECARVPAPAYSPGRMTAFPDPVSALIDAERAARFGSAGAFFESEYALVLMYEPPRSDTLAMDEFLYNDDAPKDSDPEQARLAQLGNVLAELEDYLGSALHMRRMGAYERTMPDGDVALRDDLVDFLHYTLTGSVQPINIPPCPTYLNAVIGSHELLVGDTPMIDDQFIGVVAIDGLPAESWPNCLSVLDNQGMPYRWSTRFIYCDQPDALAQLRAVNRKWAQKQIHFMDALLRSAKPRVNEDAVVMVRAAQAAEADAQSGLVAFGYLTANVILHAPTRQLLDERCATVVREIRRIGFGARRETINTLEAWLGSIPGHADPNVRRPMVHTLNLADLMPLASTWPGLESNPCPFYPPSAPPLLQAATGGSTPYRLHLHVGDVGHTLIFGPTGAGKSVLLALLAASSLRYPKARVVAFDVGYSMFPLAAATGGEHYSLAGDAASLELAPLADLTTEADLAWACEWIGALYELQQGEAPSPRQREEVFRAMCQLRLSDLRSLTDFVMSVQDEALRSALSPYTVAGPMGYLLDGKSETLSQAPVVVFEIRELLQLSDKSSLPVLLHLFRRIEKSLTGDPTLLILDEAWVMLGHPVFRERVRDWLKTLRKRNCAVVMATQQISDATRSGILDVLVEACPTKIFLPNDEARHRGTPETPGPRAVYEAMGLNATEVELIAGGVKKRQYYVRSSDGRRMIDLALGPIALSFCGASDPDSLRRIAALREQHGEAWPFVWLNERGVNYERYL